MFNQASLTSLGVISNENLRNKLDELKRDGN